MSNRLKTLVAFIQAITGKTVEEVAKSINYTRPHLTKEMGKEEGNAAIEKILAEKYHREMEEFFDDRSLILGEDQAEYGKDVKVVDAEDLLVHDSLQIKGMLRVVLRNQASIIAALEGKPVASVLKKISKALKDELKEEFDDEL